MRTTINLDDALVAEAQRITGVTERTALIHEALRALIERKASRAVWRQPAPAQGCSPAPFGDRAEVMSFIEQRALMGRGIGSVDARLPASAALGAAAGLGTVGRRLAAVAADLRLAHAVSV